MTCERQDDRPESVALDPRPLSLLDTMPDSAATCPVAMKAVRSPQRTLMRTAAQRIAKHAAKTDPVVVRPKVAAQLPTMPPNYAAFVTKFVPKEVATRSILSEEGVSGPVFLPYHNFSRRLYNRSERFGGEALARMAETLIATEVTRGLERHILDRIRTEVWNLGPPLAGVSGTRKSTPSPRPRA